MLLILSLLLSTSLFLSIITKLLLHTKGTWFDKASYKMAGKIETLDKPQQYKAIRAIALIAMIVGIASITAVVYFLSLMSGYWLSIFAFIAVYTFPFSDFMSSFKSNKA